MLHCSQWIVLESFNCVPSKAINKLSFMLLKRFKCPVSLSALKIYEKTGNIWLLKPDLEVFLSSYQLVCFWPKINFEHYLYLFVLAYAKAQAKNEGLCMKNIENALSAASSIVYRVCGAPVLKSGKPLKTLRKCLISSFNSNFVFLGSNG